MEQFKIYANNDYSVIIRVIRICANDEIKVINCRTREIKYLPIKSFFDYKEIDTKTMLKKLGLAIPSYYSLDKVERREVLLRYSIITSLICIKPNENFYYVLANICTTYNVKSQFVMKLYRLYSIYMDLTCLLPHFEKPYTERKQLYDLGCKVNWISSYKNECYFGNAILICKKFEVFKDKPIYLRLMFDLETYCLIGVGTDRESDRNAAISCINDIIRRFHMLPNKIITKSDNASYNALFHVLNSKGVRILYAKDCNDYLSESSINELRHIITKNKNLNLNELVKKYFNNSNSETSFKYFLNIYPNNYYKKNSLI